MKLARQWMVIGGCLLCMVLGSQWGCIGDTGVVEGFECKPNPQGSDGCDNDKICQNGKCVKVDKDKDGWAKGKDCDDDSPFVYPGAVEICDNKADDNCNGKIDEQPCDCKEGSERACGPETKGICKQGLQRCKNGAWGACEGEIQPTKEACDNLDNDCNGKIDDNLQGSCYAGPDGTEGKGICEAGQRSCKDGKWSKCEAQVLPTNEDCNGKDDDCDGFVDKDLKRSCYDGPDKTEGRGECKAGNQRCIGGKWGKCEGMVKPNNELCDGKDNDCNGMIDEGLQARACYDGPGATKDVGACRGGISNCDKGQWTSCQGQVTPKPKEVCDNKIDDNCDGTVDEGCVARLFEVKQTIDTDAGELDGVPYSKFSNGTFELPSFRIPANARVVVTGKNPLHLKVKGRIEILGTLDVSGPSAKDINCQTTTAETNLLGRAGGGKGGDGGNCNTKGLAQPQAGDGGGAGGGKAGQPEGLAGSAAGGTKSTSGGGGGGGYSAKGDDGSPTSKGGLGGPAATTPTSATAGSGGGGGGCAVVYIDLGVLRTALYVPGASGGPGGGAVKVESTTGDVVIKGSILAQGGDGGKSILCRDTLNNEATSGGGGGGSGGTIHVAAKGQISIDITALLNARGGKGNGVSPGVGGNGAAGRILLQDGDGKIKLPANRINPAPTQSTY